MRNICVITTTRAEYGLLYWLMDGIRRDIMFELQLVVTGTHLSPQFGTTIDRIREDGFKIDRSFDMDLHGDKPRDIIHALAVGLEGFSSAFNTLKPDLVVSLGDRFELLGVAAAALANRIPVAHIHGGELTFGAIDDLVRHAVTKLSHLHFTSTEAYRKRVIQMGEDPKRVFMVGALGIDQINKLDLLTREEVESSTGFYFGNRNLLVTYHPETAGSANGENQIVEIIGALNQLRDTHFLITFPNADAGHRIIIEKLTDFCTQNPRAILVESLGQLRYLSAMKYMDGVIGNSSSGIIEAPAFHIGTVNIGNRQEGRMRADSIIDCQCEKKEILAAVKSLYSKPFQEKLKKVINPYGNGGAADKIIEVLRTIDWTQLGNKRFYDV